MNDDPRAAAFEQALTQEVLFHAFKSDDWAGMRSVLVAALCAAPDAEALRAERDAEARAEIATKNAAIATVLRGFDEGVFVRSIDSDLDPAWAIKLFPYLRALAALAPLAETKDDPYRYGPNQVGNRKD